LANFLKDLLMRESSGSYAGAGEITRQTVSIELYTG
jgi:hypothetical protein